MSRSGWRTTEFWVVAAITIITVLNGSGVLEVDLEALLAAAAASLGYSLSRAKVKANGGGESE